MHERMLASNRASSRGYLNIRFLLAETDTETEREEREMNKRACGPRPPPETAGTGSDRAPADVGTI